MTATLTTVKISCIIFFFFLENLATMGVDDHVNTYQSINVDKFVLLPHGFPSSLKVRDNQSFLVEFYLHEHLGEKF